MALHGLNLEHFQRRIKTQTWPDIVPYKEHLNHTPPHVPILAKRAQTGVWGC